MERLASEGFFMQSRSQDYIPMEARNIHEYEDYFEAKEIMEAHVLALGAYGHSDLDEASKVAKAALEISPICPEAYNVLAVTTATSYEEALDLYKKAEELGPKVGSRSESCHYASHGP
jgi:tetratricopeptide (TPR) repeat protein